MNAGVRAASAPLPDNVRSVEALLALSDFKATFGLVVVFFVVFPALVTGLIVFAVGQALGERAENQEHAEGLDRPKR